MSIEEYWDEFVKKFDWMYKNAEEKGVSHCYIDKKQKYLG